MTRPSQALVIWAHAESCRQVDLERHSTPFQEYNAIQCSNIYLCVHGCQSLARPHLIEFTDAAIHDFIPLGNGTASDTSGDPNSVPEA